MVTVTAGITDTTHPTGAAGSDATDTEVHQAEKESLHRQG